MSNCPTSAPTELTRRSATVPERDVLADLLAVALDDVGIALHPMTVLRLAHRVAEHDALAAAVDAAHVDRERH